MSTTIITVSGVALTASLIAGIIFLKHLDATNSHGHFKAGFNLKDGVYTDFCIYPSTNAQ